MAIIKGAVPVGGFFAPTDDTDTFGVTDPRWSIGGFSTWAAWSNILAIPKGRRRLGMMVFNASNSTYYTLITDPAGDTTLETDWEEFVAEPKAHDHVEADITDLDKNTVAEVNAKDAIVQGSINTHKADETNPHAVTASQVGAAPEIHTHTESQITDLDKYTQAEVNTSQGVQDTAIGLNTTHRGKTDNPHNVSYSQLGGTQPAPVAHTHVEANITDLDKYTQEEVNTALDTKEDSLGIGDAGQILAINAAGTDKEWVENGITNLPTPFDIVADAVNADLEIGDKVNISGFYEFGDGYLKQGIVEAKSTQVIDNGMFFDMSNGLVLHINMTDKVKLASWWGIKLNDPDVDEKDYAGVISGNEGKSNARIIRNIFTHIEEGDTYVFPAGNVYIDEKISVYDVPDNITIDFSRTTFIASEFNNQINDLGKSNAGFFHFQGKRTVIASGGKLSSQSYFTTLNIGDEIKSFREGIGAQYTLLIKIAKSSGDVFVFDGKEYTDETATGAQINAYNDNLGVYHNLSSNRTVVYDRAFTFTEGGLIRSASISNRIEHDNMVQYLSHQTRVGSVLGNWLMKIPKGSTEVRYIDGIKYTSDTGDGIDAYNGGIGVFLQPSNQPTYAFKFTGGVTLEQLSYNSHNSGELYMDIDFTNVEAGHLIELTGQHFYQDISENGYGSYYTGSNVFELNKVSRVVASEKKLETSYPVGFDHNPERYGDSTINIVKYSKNFTLIGGNFYWNYHASAEGVSYNSGAGDGLRGNAIKYFENLSINENRFLADNGIRAGESMFNVTNIFSGRVSHVRFGKAKKAFGGGGPFGYGIHFANSTGIITENSTGTPGWHAFECSVGNWHLIFRNIEGYKEDSSYIATLIDTHGACGSVTLDNVNPNLQPIVWQRLLNITFKNIDLQFASDSYGNGIDAWGPEFLQLRVQMLNSNVYYFNNSRGRFTYLQNSIIDSGDITGSLVSKSSTFNGKLKPKGSYVQLDNSTIFEINYNYSKEQSHDVFRNSIISKIVLDANSVAVTDYGVVIGQIIDCGDIKTYVGKTTKKLTIREVDNSFIADHYEDNNVYIGRMLAGSKLSTSGKIYGENFFDHKEFPKEVLNWQDFNGVDGRIDSVELTLNGVGNNENINLNNAYYNGVMNIGRDNLTIAYSLKHDTYINGTIFDSFDTASNKGIKFWMSGNTLNGKIGDGTIVETFEVTKKASRYGVNVITFARGKGERDGMKTQVLYYKDGNYHSKYILQDIDHTSYLTSPRTVNHLYSIAGTRGMAFYRVSNVAMIYPKAIEDILSDNPKGYVKLIGSEHGKTFNLGGAKGSFKNYGDIEKDGAFNFDDWSFYGGEVTVTKENGLVPIGVDRDIYKITPITPDVYIYMKRKGLISSYNAYSLDENRSGNSSDLVFGKRSRYRIKTIEYGKYSNSFPYYGGLYRDNTIFQGEKNKPMYIDPLDFNLKPIGLVIDLKDNSSYNNNPLEKDMISVQHEQKENVYTMKRVFDVPMGAFLNKAQRTKLYELAFSPKEVIKSIKITKSGIVNAPGGDAEKGFVSFYFGGQKLTGDFNINGDYDTAPRYSSLTDYTPTALEEFEVDINLLGTTGNDKLEGVFNIEVIYLYSLTPIVDIVESDSLTAPADVSATPTLADVQAILDYAKEIAVKSQINNNVQTTEHKP